MKRTIRTGCFETNSSSMHCWIIGNDDNYRDSGWFHQIDDEGYLQIPEKYSEEDNRFGYGFEVITDAETKALYVLAAYSQDEYECYQPWRDITQENEIVQEVFEALEEINPELKGIVPAVNLKGKAKHCRQSDIKTKYGRFDLVPYWGRINHNSEGVLQAFFRSPWGEDVSIREFILNTKYALVIDSDEDSGLVKLQNAGALDNRKVFGAVMYSKKDHQGTWDRSFDCWEE